MLGLPISSEVNKRIPKESFYRNAPPKAEVQEAIREQIEAIFWRHKLAPSVMNVAVGERINEIQVFELQLRQKSLDKQVLLYLTKAIPYKLLFILSFAQDAQAYLEVEGTLYCTAWQASSDLDVSLRFEGIHLDAMYASLARQIAGGRLDASGDIAQAVELDKQRRQMERQITALEKKMEREKQLRRKMELNSELRKLREQLNELSAKKHEGG